MDKFKVLKNLYQGRYGNTDLDVLGITLIKIDDLLDQILMKSYMSNKGVQREYQRLSVQRQKGMQALKMLRDSMNVSSK